jgi:hypothetical protein
MTVFRFILEFLLIAVVIAVVATAFRRESGHRWPVLRSLVLVAFVAFVLWVFIFHLSLWWLVLVFLVLAIVFIFWTAFHFVAWMLALLVLIWLILFGAFNLKGAEQSAKSAVEQLHLVKAKVKCGQPDTTKPAIHCDASSSGFGPDALYDWTVVGPGGIKLQPGDQHMVPKDFDVSSAGVYIVSLVVTKNGEESNKVALDAVHVVAPAAASGSSSTCPDGHIVKQPGREHNDLNDQGAQQRGPGSEAAFKQQALDQAAVDPVTLLNYYVASPAQESNPLPSATDPSKLVEGGIVKDGVCYSQLGIDAFKRWSKLWRDKAHLTYRDEVTYQGTNTGVEDGRVVQSSGVSGSDKEGVDVSYDGDRHKHDHSILYRCTQVTTGKPIAGVPKGQTDNREVTNSTTAASSTTSASSSSASHTTPAASTTQVPTQGKVAPTRTVGPDPAQNPQDAAAPSTVIRPTTSASAAPTWTQQPTIPANQAPVTSPQPAPSASATPSPSAQVDCDQDNNGIPDPGCG